MSVGRLHPALVLAWSLALGAPAAVPRAASAQVIHPHKLQGRWTQVNPGDWGGAAGRGTHLILVRGNGDSSWVLHFDGKFGNDQRLWLAKPEADTSLGIDLSVADSNRIFCAGHSALADGRQLVVGGEIGNHSGPRFAYLFDATRWFEPGRGWTRTADMIVDRRYAASTTLGDGRVLVLSGQRNWQAVAFGGVDGGGVRRDDFGTLNLTDLVWGGDPTTIRPAPREGHSAVFDPGTQWTLVFGGHAGAGPRNDLWSLARTPVDAGERWSWSARCDTCAVVRPAARWRHTAVSNGDTMVVFGGLDAGGQALGDVWRYIRSQNRWLPLTTTGGPLYRYGHTAIVVPGRANAQPPNNVPLMLVFGGRDATHALADSTVWALRLPPSGNASWSPLATGSGPPAREGHTMVPDQTRQRPGEFPPRRRAYLFAGEGRAGVTGDLWALSRDDVSTSVSEPWSWSQVTIPSPPFPAPRSGHAAVHDTEWDRMLVYGGDTTGAVPGGLTDHVWAFGLGYYRGGTPAWQPLATGDSVPAPRSGHSIVFHQGQLLARVGERFTANDAHAPPGDWSLLAGSSKYLPYYPHMFLLRNGKLLYAGNGLDGRSGVFDPATETWSADVPSGFVGSFSVMFRPDTVLKCGGDVFVPGSAARIAVVDSATSTLTWGAVATPPMPEARMYHNLTLLPTGEVLMTAGMSASNVSVRHPRLWNSADARQWSDTLAREPVARQYHSAALLLPDGRVLSSGGPPSPTEGTVFWPPYLFNRDGTPATRPQIRSAPSGMPYGWTTRITCDTASAIGIVCLIRAGSVTHQSNFDQRYVRLAFSAASDTELVVATPLSPNHAPPGDYLLFLVKTRSGVTDSIPSVARWVRVGTAPGVDVPPPAKMPLRFALEGGHPNPSAERTVIGFALPVAARVEIQLFDPQGRAVRRLVDGVLGPGPHQVAWDLQDAAGRRVAPGLYLVRMRAAGWVGRRKVVVLP